MPAVFLSANCRIWNECGLDKGTRKKRTTQDTKFHEGCDFSVSPCASARTEVRTMSLLAWEANCPMASRAAT